MGSASSSTSSTDEMFADDKLTPRLYELAKIDPCQWPIVYSPVYNIGFLGLEKIHPFDSAKWGKIYKNLLEHGMLKGSQSIITPHEVNRAELLVTHTEGYLSSLNYSYNVAFVVEVPPVALLPNFVVQTRMLKPFRYHTGGTIMAGKLARERGWAINIGGGFHHCSSGEGGGFCAYADITLCIKFMFKYLEGVSRVMIVDFDAHQGNGHERDFISDERVYIMDMYNRWIYPNDRQAKDAIRRKIELDVHTGDEVYLEHIRRELPRALDEFQPDMVVYNAGTDILKGDPLGVLDITPEGVKERDRLVFSEVRKARDIPIIMLTSGGYQRNNADVISDSILNLREKGLITAPEDDPHVTSELRNQGAPLPTSSDDEHPKTTPHESDDEEKPSVDEEAAKEEKSVERRKDEFPVVNQNTESGGERDK